MKVWAKQSGFTIVELLIVIVVIGILAAISIVAYSGVRDKASLSIVQADVTSAKKKLMAFKVEEGNYPLSTADLTRAGVRISDVTNYDIRLSYSNFYYCAGTSNNDFAIGVRVAGSKVSSFYVTSGEGISEHAGLISLSGTCAKIGLPGTLAADGAYSASGISGTGSLFSWING